VLRATPPSRLVTHGSGLVVSRRTVLLGTVGISGAAILTACSGQDSTRTGSSSSTSGTQSKPVALLARFDQNEFARAGAPQRLVFSLGAGDGSAAGDAPEKLDFTISSDGQPVGETLTSTRHDDGVPISYFPLTFTPPRPGIYRAATTLDGKEASVTFTVGGSENKLPQVGDKMIPVQTPTTADPHGVDPICTRKPSECPFHSVTLADALTAGKPVAFIISTPEFCQIGVCGPVLQLLMDQQPNHPQVTFVHAEVFRTRLAADTTEAVGAYHLTYEPSLFVARADGTIVDRLDFVFDRQEIAAALQKATS